MPVRWLRAAISDLDAEASSIAQEDEEMAVEIYAHVRSRVEMPSAFPESGRPGRIFGTRELVMGKYPYIVPYRIKGDVVEILRVFHTRRKPPRLR